MSEKPKNKIGMQQLNIPSAIVLAGVIVAVAILISRGGSTPYRVVEGQGLSAGLYVALASDLGIEADEFNACRNDQRILSRIQDDSDKAQASGGQGTPYSVVVDANGNARPVSGAIPYEQFVSVVEEAITGFSESSSSAERALPVGDDEHIRGSVDAPVTIIEFSDFQCPYCGLLHPTLQTIIDEYKGDVRWVYRHLPLANHPEAVPAAIASECVADLAGNDAFWTFVDEVFTAQ